MRMKMKERPVRFCLVCGEEIPYEFGKRRVKFHQVCRGEGRKRYLERTRGYRNVRQLDYYYAHKKEEAERRRGYYLRNRERILSGRKVYWLNNRGRILEKRKLERKVQQQKVNLF